MRYPGGPIDRRLERGDTVIWDRSMRAAGYWSDCANTLVVEAKLSAEQRRYVRAARRAFEARVEALRPSTLAGEAATAARRVFLSEGFDVRSPSRCAPSATAAARQSRGRDA